MRTLSTLLVVVLVGWSTASAAGDLGFIARNGDRYEIRGQKTIWNASRSKVTVYFLPCPYTPEMLKDWSTRDGHMHCPLTNTTPRDALRDSGAKLTFELGEGGILQRLTFESQGIGGYQAVRRTWQSDFPVEAVSVSNADELVFRGTLEIPKKNLRAVINGGVH